MQERLTVPGPVRRAIRVAAIWALAVASVLVAAPTSGAELARLATVAPSDDDWQTLLKTARARRSARAAFADRIGAIAEPIASGRAFTLYWSPVPDEPLGTRPVIVTLHGSEGFAYDEMALWHPDAAARGYAILALQWWLTSGAGPDDYLRPREAYDALTDALRTHGAEPDSALLHGFSRGSANVYGVAALDRAEGDHFFRFVVANSGGATQNYPINQEIAGGAFGATPFGGTTWATYCGGQDPNPDRDGCPAMRRSAAWVTRLGGVLAVVIEDAARGHGGFHETPAHVRQVLDAFAGATTGS